jgi:hypothetical protein
MTDPKPLNDIWLIQPNAKSNSTLVVDNANPKSFYRGRPSAYLMGFTVNLLAFNISALARGRPPVARYSHQALSLSRGKYLLISGGRNNSLYMTMGNIALNDLHLLNTQTFEWETLAMYGEVPVSRWNHSLIAIEEGKDDRLVIFGGMNMATYMNASQVQVFEFGEYAVEKFLAKAT